MGWLERKTAMPRCGRLLQGMFLVSTALAAPMSIGWFRPEVLVDCNPPETMDWSALTHLTYGHQCPMQSGQYNCTKTSLNPSPGILSRVLTAARKNNIKVLLMVSWSFDDAPWNSSEASEVFVSSVADAVQEFGFDGVEYDVECLPANETVRDLYTRNVLIPTKAALLKATGAADRSVVGADLAAYNYNPFVFVDNSTALYDVIDFFNVMAYNWQKEPTSSDHPFPPASEKAMTTLAAYGIPKTKINLGIGWYTTSQGAVCSMPPACLDGLKTSPNSNICGELQYDGPAMSYNMAQWAAVNGWGGVMQFCVNYDYHNALLTPLGEGLRNGTAQRTV